MTRDLSRFQQDLIMVVWWALWAGVCLFCVLLAGGMLGDAVSLSISGQASGQGLHLLNFSGESLNVSILQNGSAWNLTLGGMA